MKAVIKNTMNEADVLPTLKSNAATAAGLNSSITALQTGNTNIINKLNTIQGTVNKGFFENPKPTDIFLFVVACLYCLVLLAGATGSLIRNFSK